MDTANIIGKKPVMFVFWASWCPSCKIEVPNINRLVEKYRDLGMAFIGINIGLHDSVKKYRHSWLRQTYNTRSSLIGEGRVSKNFSILGVPAVIVADRKGVVKFKNYGLPTISDEEFLELLSN